LDDQPEPDSSVIRARRVDGDAEKVGPSNPGLVGEWASEPVVDPVGPVGRCNGHNQFHDLFLVEVLTECVEVDVIDVARVAGQQVGEAQDSLLDWVEEAGVAPAAGLTQSGDLVVVVPSPPRRG
jgi:hypothetical protein